MAHPEIDPTSPVPLYHQIAEAIRQRIRAGDLAEGDVLEPLREAAEAWGVNLHTVRHAYSELAREGLVSIERKRGTRVIGSSGAESPAEVKRSLDSFLEEIAYRAGREFGLSIEQLAARLSARGAHQRPCVHVVECSAWECACHVRELEARFDLEAAPFVLSESDELPEGDVLATYFHYNEIRRRWPRRLRNIQFVRTGPDLAVLTGLGIISGPVTVDVVLCELDEVTASTVASDLEAIAPEGALRVRTFVVDEPLEAANVEGEAPVLLSPRMWGGLTEAARANARLHELRYIFEDEELQRAAERFGWRSIAQQRGPKSGVRASNHAGLDVGARGA